VDASELIGSIESSFRNASAEALLRDDVGGAKAYLEAIGLVRAAVGESLVIDKPQLATLDEVDRLHADQVLRLTSWNKAMAARILGIERSTLNRKIKRWNLAETGKPICNIAGQG